MGGEKAIADVEVDDVRSSIRITGCVPAKTQVAVLALAAKASMAPVITASGRGRAKPSAQLATASEARP